MGAEIIPASGAGAATKVKIQVGKSPSFAQRSYRTVFTIFPGKTAMLLRLDEYLVSADGKWSVRFESDGSLYAYEGDVSKPGPHRVAARFGPSVVAMQERFEVYLGLDRQGVVSCNYGTGPDDYKELLLSANAPTPAVTNNVPAFLAIETVEDLPALRLYQGVMPTDPLKKLVVELGWTQSYKLAPMAAPPAQ